MFLNVFFIFNFFLVCFILCVLNFKFLGLLIVIESLNILILFLLLMNSLNFFSFYLFFISFMVLSVLEITLALVSLSRVWSGLNIIINF
uniref:NADH dehydrogenase subunit 4L n=1 Tax=Paratetraonchoides inermis TaxID=2048240 RepID=A0A2D1GRS3_9PLAT|nr:NADH dehydrogenase subunit 4L [Paratetraonchoides inermis]ATN95411.1 NADH dehydrogenase subunit 4L [Paratetraonchoides inermis]